jgi:hypothetical protein
MVIRAMFGQQDVAQGNIVTPCWLDADCACCMKCNLHRHATHKFVRHAKAKIKAQNDMWQANPAIVIVNVWHPEVKGPQAFLQRIFIKVPPRWQDTHMQEAWGN